MQHFQEMLWPVHQPFAHWIRGSVALLITLAAPLVSISGAVTTGLKGTSPAVSFPPGSCWLVFTDMVLHAALGGEFALEQTFHLDVDELAEPDLAPIRVLERLSGRTLI